MELVPRLGGLRHEFSDNGSRCLLARLLEVSPFRSQYGPNMEKEIAQIMNNWVEDWNNKRIDDLMTLYSCKSRSRSSRTAVSLWPNFLPGRICEFGSNSEG